MQTETLLSIPDALNIQPSSPPRAVKAVWAQQQQRRFFFFSTSYAVCGHFVRKLLLFRLGLLICTHTWQERDVANHKYEQSRFYTDTLLNSQYI